MFTLAQIEAAHLNVKSGADFPAYIRAIKALGVTRFTTFVSDGHTAYHGANGYTTSSAGAPAVLAIAGTYDRARFEKALQAHQQGKTGYVTFVNDCAACGVEKWSVSLVQMTCTYYDPAGHEVLVEPIPQ